MTDSGPRYVSPYIGLLTCVLLGLALPAHGQEHAPDPKNARRPLRSSPRIAAPAGWDKIEGGPPRYVPGKWARYALSHPERNVGTLQMSVVPQSDLGDPTLRILEVRNDDPSGDKTYYKVLFRRFPEDPKNVIAIMVKTPGLPPLTMPVMSPKTLKQAKMELTQVQTGRIVRVRDLGKATVTVPAGTFHTRKYLVESRDEEGETREQTLWIDLSGKVPIQRSVKMRFSDGTVAELEAFGDGAKTDLPPFDRHLVDNGTDAQGMGKEKTK